MTVRGYLPVGGSGYDPPSAEIDDKLCLNDIQATAYGVDQKCAELSLGSLGLSVLGRELSLYTGINQQPAIKDHHRHSPRSWPSRFL